MPRLIAAAFALAASYGAAVAGISFDEEIPAFRRGVDAWRAESGVRGNWTDSGFEVVASGCPGTFMWIIFIRCSSRRKGLLHNAAAPKVDQSITWQP